MMLLRRFNSTAPASMRRLIIKTGSPNMAEVNLAVETVPVPTPAAGEVLIKMTAAAVNPSDYTEWEWVGDVASGKPLGKEGAGEIVGGDGKPGTKVGVVGLPEGQGTWSEYVVANAQSVYPLPADIPAEDAASFFVNPFTAVGIIDTARAHAPNKTFVHTAAASQLGRMIVRLAKEDGDVNIINVVRKEEQAETLRELGADHVVVASEKDRESMKVLKTKMRELDCSVCFDAVGGTMASSLLKLAPQNGKVFSYGGFTGLINGLDPVDIIYGGKELNGWLLNRWLISGGKEAIGPRIAATTARCVSGLAGGWSSSTFKDTSLEKLHGDLVDLVSQGATGAKLRVRFD